MSLNKNWLYFGVVNIFITCFDKIHPGYPGICMEKRRKITKSSFRIAGLRAVIWTRDIPNTKQVC